MNLTDLETFILVASSGSVTAAAKSLGVPKSTVSRRLKRLEEELGQPLITRSANRIGLTAQGVLLHERCEPAIETLHNAERELEGMAEEPVGTLRITTLSILGLASSLTELFLEFVRLHPRVTLEVFNTDQVMDLVEERIDVALRPTGASITVHDVRLHSRPLGAIHGALYASPDYLARRGRPERVEEISEHIHVATTVFQNGVTLLGPRGRKHRVPLAARYYTSSVSPLLHATCSGATVGILPPLLAAPEVARGQLVPLLEPWRARGAQIDIVYPTTSLVLARARALITFLEERAAQSGLLSLEDA